MSNYVNIVTKLGLLNSKREQMICCHINQTHLMQAIEDLLGFDNEEFEDGLLEPTVFFSN